MIRLLPSASAVPDETQHAPHGDGQHTWLRHRRQTNTPYRQLPTLANEEAVDEEIVGGVDDAVEVGVAVVGVLDQDGRGCDGLIIEGGELPRPDALDGLAI